MKALIIGGGIAGPVTAIALQKAGLESVIYEAYDSTAEGIGGSMGIAPNGLNAFDLLGLGETVRAVGIATPRMVMQNYRGRVIADIPTLSGLPDMYTVNRGDLYAMLRQAALDRGIVVHHGKRLVSASRRTAVFADGTSADGDVIIGADGIRSTLRTIIDPKASQPRYTGLIGMGGYVSGSGVPSTGGAMHFIFGKRAFFGYQVEGEVALWFGNVPRKVPLTAAEAKAVPVPQWLSELRALYSDDQTPALSLVRDEQFIVTGALEDLPVVPTWHRDRMVLVGDAAHATSPSSGQGASLAVESAIELARCLRDIADVPTAFRAYENLRRARVERIIAASARVNNDKAAGPFARVIRDLMFPLAMHTFYRPEKMFGSSHRHAIRWDASVA